MLEIIEIFTSRHKNNINRLLHIIGIPLALIGVVQLFMAKWGAGVINILLGYALQMVGHFYFEKNKPSDVLLIRKILEKISGSRNVK